MKVLELLDELEEIMKTSTGLVLTGKVMVNPDEVLEIVKEIRAELPQEIEQARHIKSERQRIIEDARSEYETVMKDAQRQSEMLVENHEITVKAKAKADEIIKGAKAASKQLKLGTFDYIDGILYNFQDKLDRLNGEHFMAMFNNMEQTFEAIGETLTENRNEIKELAYNTQMDIK